MIDELPSINTLRDFAIEQQQHLPVFYCAREALQSPVHYPIESMAQWFGKLHHTNYAF